MALFQKTTVKTTNNQRKGAKGIGTTALTPSFCPLNVNELKLASYQRGLRQSRVRAYVENYDKDIFGTILVSYRDGQYWIVDGQHRVEVAKALGIDTVWCQVIEHLTYEQEADKFYRVNDSKARLNANHKFHAMVEKKEEWATDIVKALNQYGFRYSKEGNEHSDNCINAVGSLRMIYRKQGYDGLCLVLRTLRQVWNGDRTSLQAEIIKGLNTFFVNYDCDKKFLIKVLETNAPKSISDRARVYIQNIRKPSDGVCFHIAKVIRDLYDDGAARTKGKVSMCTPKMV